MQYLVKVFEPGEGVDFTPHIATDDGNDRTEGSLWNWLQKASREKLEISVYRMTRDFAKAGRYDPILVVNQDDSLDILWASELGMLAELEAEPDVAGVYVLENVLDLS